MSKLVLTDGQQVTLDACLIDSQLRSKIAMIDQIIAGLKEQKKKLDKDIIENNRTYNEACISRRDRAVEFCEDKTIDQLKEYLSHCSLAYDMWQNEDYDMLVEFIIGIYD